MIQTNSWAEKTTVQKGNYGEMVVKQYLESKGWIVYGVETEGSHAFDKLCVKDKKHIIISEIKTKPRRLYYEDTGFDIRHYNEYTFIQNKYKLDIFIFFVDEELKKIYGNKLIKLERPLDNYIGKTIKGNLCNPKTYPSKENNIIYFPLIYMKDIESLTEKDASFLKEHNTRNYSY